ncbi:MAG TPA: hypothetical protein VFH27_10255 [Longimicrobiaceae bacterium]|nr:hypothetical protein [Longimicrobiaceae bacterium]
MTAPVEHFRMNDRRSPFLGVETEIDHLRTWLYVLGDSFMSGALLDYSARATELAGDVEQIRASVLDIPSEDHSKQRYVEYLAAMQRVVDALQASPESPPGDLEAPMEPPDTLDSLHER